jgi:hypothetical protein
MITRLIANAPGNLSSKPGEKNVKFNNFSISVGGNQLVKDCDVELTQG